MSRLAYLSLRVAAVVTIACLSAQFCLAQRLPKLNAHTGTPGAGLRAQPPNKRELLESLQDQVERLVVTQESLTKWNATRLYEQRRNELMPKVREIMPQKGGVLIVRHDVGFTVEDQGTIWRFAKAEIVGAFSSEAEGKRVAKQPTFEADKNGLESVSRKFKEPNSRETTETTFEWIPTSQSIQPPPAVPRDSSKPAQDVGEVLQGARTAVARARTELDAEWRELQVLNDEQNDERQLETQRSSELSDEDLRHQTDEKLSQWENAENAETDRIKKTIATKSDEASRTRDKCSDLYWNWRCIKGFTYYTCETPSHKTEFEATIRLLKEKEQSLLTEAQNLQADIKQKTASYADRKRAQEQRLTDQLDAQRRKADDRTKAAKSKTGFANRLADCKSCEAMLKRLQAKIDTLDSLQKGSEG